MRPDSVRLSVISSGLGVPGGGPQRWGTSGGALSVLSPMLLLALCVIFLGCACPTPPSNSSSATVRQPFRPHANVTSCEYFCRLAFDEAPQPLVSCRFLDDRRSSVACAYDDGSGSGQYEESTIENVDDIPIDRPEELTGGLDHSLSGTCGACTGTSAYTEWLRAGFHMEEIGVQCTSDVVGKTLGTLELVITCFYASECYS